MYRWSGIFSGISVILNSLWSRSKWAGYACYWKTYFSYTHTHTHNNEILFNWIKYWLLHLKWDFSAESISLMLLIVFCYTTALPLHSQASKQASKHLCLKWKTIKSNTLKPVLFIVNLSQNDGGGSGGGPSCGYAGTSNTNNDHCTQTSTFVLLFVIVYRSHFLTSPPSSVHLARLCILYIFGLNVFDKWESACMPKLKNVIGRL